MSRCVHHVAFCARSFTEKVGLIKPSKSRNASLDLQSAFDQMELSEKELNDFDGLDTTPLSNYLVTLSIPIKAQIDIAHAIKHKPCHLRMTETHEQHDKNNKLLFLSIPFLVRGAC